MAVSKPRLSWFELEDLRRAMLTFYDSHVQELDMDRSGMAHHIRQYLLKDLYDAGLILEIKYTGSAYEGTYVGSEYDYDAMIVLKMGNQVDLRAHNPQDLFSVVQYVGSLHDQLSSCHRSDNLLVPSDMREVLKRAIAKRVGNNLPYDGGQLSLSLINWINPIVQVDMTKPGFRKVSFTMDFVVSIRVNNDVYYTASPIRQQPIGGQDRDKLWKRTKAYDETIKLSNIDDGNLISKKVLRIYKGIRKSNRTLSAVPPYATKSCFLVMRTNHPYSDGQQWTDPNLAQRFVDFLYEMYRGCCQETFPTYPFPRVNVLETGKDRENARTAARYLERIMRRGFSGIKELMEDK